MKKTEVTHPDIIHENVSTGAYSAGVIIDDWLYVSGQGPVDFQTGNFLTGSLEEEIHLTMHNIQRICEAAGCSLNDIVKCTAYLSDINDFAQYNEIYARYFDGVKPARTTVQAVLVKGIKVEIDAIAKIPKKH